MARKHNLGHDVETEESLRVSRLEVMLSAQLARVEHRRSVKDGAPESFAVVGGVEWCI